MKQVNIFYLSLYTLVIICEVLFHNMMKNLSNNVIGAHILELQDQCASSSQKKHRRPEKNYRMLFIRRF